jgi:DNA polymerase III delta subunit
MEKAQIYLVSGNDNITKNDYIQDIISKTLGGQDANLNLHVFYAHEVNGQEIENIGLAVPMLSPVQVILIRGVNKVSDIHLKFLENFLTHKVESTRFILECEKPDARRKFFKQIKAQPPAPVKIVTREFKKPYDDKMPAWAVQRARSKYKKRISISAAAFLVERVGPDCNLVDSELNKISQACKSDTISEKDIENITYPSYSNIFKFTACVAERETANAVMELPQLFAMDPRGSQILNLLNLQFLRILKIKVMQSRGSSEEEIAKKLKLNLWFLKNKLRYFIQAGKHSVQEISEILTDLADIELKFRRTGSSPQQVLEEWLLKYACR